MTKIQTHVAGFNLFHVFSSLGPSSDNIEEDMIASSHGASATVLEESRKETTPVQLPVSGPELAAMMKIGTRVVRGVDWKWGDQVQLFSYIFWVYYYLKSLFSGLSVKFVVNQT